MGRRPAGNWRDVRRGNHLVVPWHSHPPYNYRWRWWWPSSCCNLANKAHQPPTPTRNINTIHPHKSTHIPFPFTETHK
jgi:hypothetical protein